MEIRSFHNNSSNSPCFIVKNKEDVTINFHFLFRIFLYSSDGKYNIKYSNDYYHYLNQFYFRKKQHKLILENIKEK